ncbi:MAG TPA: FG-GAP-like repeat-containing protein [Bryobacteraceae bacterium]
MAGTLLLWTACSRNAKLPAVGSDQYRELCAAFYLGLSALQSGEDVNARKGLTRATEIAPGEPAGWADLGLLQFRQQDYEGAYQSMDKAQKLIPDNSRIEALLGTVESRRGKTAETLEHLKRAVALDSSNLKALYALAQETERENSAAADAAAQNLLEKILQKQPDNIAVRIDLGRLAAKRNDAPALRRAVASLKKAAASWPDAARAQLTALERQAGGANVRPAAVQVQFLRNVLVRVPAYRQSLDEVKTPATSAGEPFVRFLKLPSPSSEPSAPDKALRFEDRPLASVAGAITWLGTFVADDKSNAEAIWVDDRGLHPGQGVTLAVPRGALGEHGLLAADLNYDFKTDLVVATEGGVRIYQQEDRTHFTDVSARTKLPPELLAGKFNGAWAFDIDLDGDLDIVLGIAAGEPVVLRNNGDSTFAVLKPFHDVDGLKAFTSADVDGDGDADVAMLDGAGQLKVFANERLGDYRLRELPDSARGQSIALAAADVNGDGLPDFVVLRADGRITRLSDGSRGHEWTSGEIARTSGTTLQLADLDNNGSMDIIAGTQVFLSDGHSYTALQTRLAAEARGFMETQAGRLDPIAIGADHHAQELMNRGTKAYHWQDVRPKAATTHGDQRINSFGIGGSIEIRSDLLTEQQIIASPILHFGLGEHTGAQFARILWPNGLIQTEFSLKANQTLAAEQRLKGSCPLLFAWNGATMQFVKDVAPMSGALGAHDGSGKFADIAQTEEWFKIGGRQLQARDGFYDLRVTDEYWEAYFIDRYSLAAVDHPAGTQVFVDERVAAPPAPLRVYLTGPSHAFASVRDNHGADVSASVAQLDHRYLDTFALGAYQGIARDHWVELELPAKAPRTGRVYLIADGWLHPWDDGILVAASQGRAGALQEMSMEVPDRHGRWQVAARDLGVPAGREKTVVFEISNLFAPGAPRKLRLRTNLEIYWDRLAWAAGASDTDLQTTDLPIADAELQHRGFSQIRQASARTPEVPEYNQLAASGNRWSAIEGYYTRYGRVRPLLEKSDDRFVIAGSGDELRMRFKAPAPARAGYTRDFIFAGDGWMKEGDYSFAHSTTLAPLPYHGMKRYDAPLTSLEQERAYHEHPADWRDFHTRYVGPEPLAAHVWKQ